MRILLPPSEGKTAPVDGPVLDLDGLSYPELAVARRRVLEALVAVSKRDGAGEILGVGRRIMPEVVARRAYRAAPCAPAREVYTGVLYEAARLHEGDDVRIFSGLFGVTTGEDLIPTYRLSMNVSLPGIGSLKAFWRRELAQAGFGRAGFEKNRGHAADGESSGFAGRAAHESVSATVGRGRSRDAADQRGAAETMVAGTTVDMRSGAYRITTPHGNWWDLRVVDSRGAVITHAAKHYRGALARALLDAGRDAAMRGGAAVDVAQAARTLGRIEVKHDGLRHHITLMAE